MLPSFNLVNLLGEPLSKSISKKILDVFLQVMHQIQVTGILLMRGSVSWPANLALIELGTALFFSILLKKAIIN